MPSPIGAVPIIQIFVLSRDGSLVYASPDFDYIKARLIQRLMHLGYSWEVIERIKLIRVNPDELSPVYKVHYPYLREEFLIHEVEAD